MSDQRWSMGSDGEVWFACRIPDAKPPASKLKLTPTGAQAVQRLIGLLARGHTGRVELDCNNGGVRYVLLTTREQYNGTDPYG